MSAFSRRHQSPSSRFNAWLAKSFGSGLGQPSKPDMETPSNPNPQNKFSSPLDALSPPSTENRYDFSQLPARYDHDLPLIDREQAFLLYATFCGDLERTAHALGLTSVTLLKMVEDEKWNDKLKPILELKKGARPGDLERAINRALNYVQAHRLRLIVERAIRFFTGLSESEFKAHLCVMPPPGAKGDCPTVKMSTRCIADLASALEKAHAMSYQALGDTAQERLKANQPMSAQDTYADMHAKIADAMAKATHSQSPRALLFDAQLKQAEALGDGNK